MSPQNSPQPHLAPLRAAAASPALLVVDVQRSFADPEHLAAFELDAPALQRVASAVDQCHTLVAQARAADVPVFWIELESSSLHPWRAVSWLHTGDPDSPLPDPPCASGTAGAEWYELAPAESETRIVKHGYSGFHHTDLRDALTARGVSWVTIAGLTTECCIMATALDAFQADYPVVIAADATTAYDPTLHEASLRTLAANAALVMPTHDIAALWTDREVAA